MSSIVGFVVRHYFDPDQPRDRKGRWTDTGLGHLSSKGIEPRIGEGGGRDKPMTLHDTPTKKSKPKPKVSAVVRGTPSKRQEVEPPAEDSIDNLRAVLAKTTGKITTGDVNLAALALGEGRQVELESTDRVSVLLDKLAAISKEAIEKGDKAPNYNLCDVTVKDTSLFCVDSKGIPRIQMPQLSGKPLPGSKAEAKGVNEKGEVDLNAEFRASLEAKGVSVTDKDVQASHLKATQNELNGGKVSGIYGAMKAGKIKDQRLFVSGDNYVVDGHHRWAAKVGADSLDGILGNDTTMPVASIDMDIIELLAESNRFAEEWGIPQAGVQQGGVKLADCGCLENLYYDPHQPRDREGKWRDVPGLPAGLVAETTPDIPAGLELDPGPLGRLRETPTPRHPAGLEEVPDPRAALDRFAAPSEPPKLTKVAAGHYASADGKWAVSSEGHGYIDKVWQDLGSGNDGWAVVYSPKGGLREDHNAGDNLDWFDTKREAIAALPRMMRDQAARDESRARQGGDLDHFRPVGSTPEGDIDIKTATDEQLAAKAAEAERAIASWQVEIDKLHKRMKRITKQGHRDDVARKSGSFRSVQIGWEYTLREIRDEQKNRAAPSLFV